MSLKGMFKNPLWIKGRIRRLEYGLSILIFYFSLFSVAFITSLLTDAVSEEMLGFFAILIFFPYYGTIILVLVGSADKTKLRYRQ